MSGETVSPWCIKLLRTAGEWSQEDLAEATGVSRDLLTDYEEGRRILKRGDLDEMIAALHLTEEDAVSLGASIPRARPWKQTGPELSEEERSAIERLSAQVTLEVETGLSTGGARPGLSAVVRSVFGRYFLEMLIREGEEWEEVWQPRPGDRFEGAELWGRLERFPVGDRNFLVDAAQEFAHWALCERICLQSAELAVEDARQAVGLADLAVRIASRVPGEDAWRARLKGYALAHVAHARFALGDFAAAAESLRDARQLWDAGAPGDPGLLDGTCLLIFESCLREDEEALAE